MSLLYAGDLAASSDDTPRDTISDTPDDGASAVAQEMPRPGTRNERHNVTTGGLQSASVASYVIPREKVAQPLGEPSVLAQKELDASGPDKGLTAERIRQGDYGHGTLPIVVGIEPAQPHAPFDNLYFAAGTRSVIRGQNDVTGPRIVGTAEDAGAVNATRLASRDARNAAYRAFLDM